MRRLSWIALALLLAASTASARILVVTERLDAKGTNNLETAISSTLYDRQQSRLTGACIDVFNLTGMTYDVVPVSGTNTWWLERGRYYPNLLANPSDSTYTQYDGVIILNALGRPVNGNVTTQLPWPPAKTGCYPCSLTVKPHYPRVPILFIHGSLLATAAGQSGGVLAMFARLGASAAVCSTGATPAASGAGAVPVFQYPANNHTAGWLSASNKLGAGSASGQGGGYIFSSAISLGTPGGVRPLLITKSGILHTLMGQSAAKINPAWVDTFMTGLNADTAEVWERLFNGYAGTVSPFDGRAVPSNARLIFANVMGVSACIDSISDVAAQGDPGRPCEFDEPTLLFALAHLDSLTGGKVWESSTSKLPLRAALTIDGAFCRTGRQFEGGSFFSDSTVLKATLDSLATLPIPYTVGVNVDSIASYPYEVSWWNKLSSARFSPQSWVGVDRYALNQAYQSISAAVDTNSYATLKWTAGAPVDVFGRYRARAFYGDSSTLHTVAGSDSSIYQGLISGRSIVQTYWPGRVSGLCMAPRDDYSPKFATNIAGWLDSLVYVVKKAGFSAIRTDVQSGDADPARFGAANRLSVRGGVVRQGSVPSLLSGDAPLKFLGQTGYSTSGSMYLAGIRALDPDTAASITEYYGVAKAVGMQTPSIPHTTVGRFWHGFVHDELGDPDWFPIGYNTDTWTSVVYPREDNQSVFHRASILKMHVSDFGGIPNGPPKRPGWWAVKSIYNQFSGINNAAGRAICVFDYPENITP